MKRVIWTFIGLLLLVGSFLNFNKASASSISLNTFNTGGCYQSKTKHPVSWTQSPDITRVRVLYGEDGVSFDPHDFKVTNADDPDWYIWWWADFVGPTSVSWNIYNLDPDKKYRVWIFGYDSSWNFLSSVSSASTFSVDRVPPSQPTPSTTSKTSNSVTIGWQKVTNTGCAPLIGYRIYRGNNLMATVNPDKTSFTDSGLSANTDYSYTVEAYDEFYASKSNELVVATNQSTQTNVTSKKDLQPTTTIKQNPQSGTSAEGILPSQANEAINNSDSSVNSDKDLLANTDININNKKIVLGNQIKHSLKKGERIKIHGKVLPNQQVTIKVHSVVVVYETISDSGGNWSEEIDTSKLEEGDHKISLSSKDTAGRVSGEVDLFRFSLSNDKQNINNIIYLFSVIVIVLILFIFKNKLLLLIKKK